MVLTKESPLKPQKSSFSPDRFLYGLLGIVSMLLLGDRFHWLGLGSQKGYTVLAAAAIVAATTTFVLLWLIASLLFRWRFQFGIRSLLVLAVIVAILCGWFVSERNETERQRQAVGEIKGGQVWYDYQLDVFGDEVPNARPPGPAFLRKVLGDDFFARVVAVHFRMPTVTDPALEPLRRLPNLRSLQISCARVTDVAAEYAAGQPQLRWLALSDTPITDAGMRRLLALRNLDMLYISRTRITSAGLEGLSDFPELRRLEVDGTKVDDLGLEHLQNCRRLEILNLAETQITDGGLRHFRNLANLVELDLGGTRITDAGLIQLEGTQIQRLYLYDTQVTDAGLLHIKAMPRLQTLVLRNTRVTDFGVEYLSGLRELKELNVNLTEVTNEGEEKLHQSLRHCKIERL